ncbi:hypothetical protein [Thermomonas sp.]|uniref:hypothetical protein n=1 Tax=Thermomonas sp. TaxID=1971895 RepID=UPI001DECE400|nr:hypothetical protein [Thermomonas sp.]MBZ0087755.1 hypothetical protein [Thermomonas sp.]MCO5054263.1 hypothetical protein [Thermomonas sp.]HRO63976.1 hypothetical protein [Thermomonas sp.]
MSRNDAPSGEYRLEFSYDAPRLTVRLIGNLAASLAASSAYWLRIGAEAKARGARQLLVLDELPSEVLAEADLPKLFEVIQHSGLRELQIAYVEGRADQMPQIEAVEMMGRERGYRVRVFSDAAEASLWLRYGEDA